MPNTQPLIYPEGEVRELTAADVKRLRPAADILPSGLMAKLRNRGPQKTPTKERITIRLSPEVLQCFRATGPGWQSRMDAVLQEWVKAHPPT